MLDNDVILSSTVEGGGTQKDHLRIRNPSDERLKPVVMDNYELYIMAVFWKLNHDRPQGMSSVATIPMSAFVNYQTLFDDTLNIDEVLLLQSLDSQFKSTIDKLNKPRSEE